MEVVDPTCPSAKFYTDEHADHEGIWLISNPSSTHQPCCLACLLELLENKDILLVKKKLVLSELLCLLSWPRECFFAIKSLTIAVHLHISLLILEMMVTGEESVTSMAIECCLKFIDIVSTEEIVTSILHTICQECLQHCDYKRCIPFLSLMGRLLADIPNLSSHLRKHYSIMVDFISAGLKFSDVSVQGIVSYLCIHLFSDADAEHPLPQSVCESLADGTLQAINMVQAPDILMNIIGLLKVLVKHESIINILMSSQFEGTTISVLKKILLNQQDILQIAVVQCMLGILGSKNGAIFANSFLESDIAEFIFEALNTSNEFLIGPLFCALLQLSECEVFFSKSHSVYGIESVLRALEQAFLLKNPENIKHGIALVSNILKRHIGGIRLFSNSQLMLKCWDLINSGINHSHQDLQISSMTALVHSLRLEHQPSPLSFQDAIKPVVSMIGQLLKISSSVKSDGQVLRLVTSRRKGKKKRQPQEVQNRLIEGVKALLRSLDLLQRLDLISEEPSSIVKEPSCSETLTPQEWCMNVFKLRVVPFIMENWCKLDDLVIYQLFMELLLKFFQQPKYDKKGVAMALVVSGFITRTLDMKAKHRDVRLNETSSAVLCEIVNILKPAETNPKIPDLKKGLNHLDGSANSFMDVLIKWPQNNTPFVLQDPDMLGTHSACLALLSISVALNSIDLDKEKLWNNLEKYIECSKGLDSLPNESFKNLLYMYATLQMDLKQEPNVEVLIKLLEAVDKKGAATNWCLIDPALLHWCFFDEKIASLLGKEMVSYFLSTGCQTHPRVMALLSDLTHQYPALFKTMIACLCSKTENIAQVIAILRDMLADKSQRIAVKDRQSFIKTEITMAIQRLFMCWIDTNIDVLGQTLELLYLVKSQSAYERINTKDLKLTTYVCNMFTCTSYSPETRLHAGMVLNAYLVQALLQGDNRVCLILTSNPSFVKCIEESYSGDLFGEPTLLFIIAHLTYQCHSFCIQSSNTFSLDINNLPHINHVGRLENLAALFFWGSVLKSLDSEHSFIQLTSSARECLSPIVLSTGNNYLNDTAIRKFYMCLQNCIVMENPAVQNLAVVCLDSLFAYLERIKRMDTRDHLLCQSWNPVLLKVVLASRDVLAQGRSKLLHALVSRDPSLLKFVDEMQIIDWFVQERDATVLSDLSDVVNQIINTKTHVMDDEKKAYLTTKLAKYTGLPKESCKVLLFRHLVLDTQS